MRVRTAEKILKLFGIKGGKPDEYGCTHTSKEYQLAYKVMKLIVEDASDAEIIEQVQKRTNLMDLPKCKKCGRLLEPCYTPNGVLDSWDCPKTDVWTGEHR